ncbi:hypothetical protein BJL90_16240 [Clostridium formicaceticum]|uniref:Uncharacterized protein n=1 Tax=Clostridium formicaceticum TaxID=1497 RepID=A0ABM6EVU8_9CLOT|nr:hypothetical protein BJL90_16240 [Clostridium formicaceticum]
MKPEKVGEKQTCEVVSEVIGGPKSFYGYRVQMYWKEPSDVRLVMREEYESEVSYLCLEVQS